MRRPPWRRRAGVVGVYFASPMELRCEEKGQAPTRLSATPLPPEFVGARLPPLTPEVRAALVAALADIALGAVADPANEGVATSPTMRKNRPRRNGRRDR